MTLQEILKRVDDILRSEGCRSGIDRFNELANILFLKLLKEKGLEEYWDDLKTSPDKDLLSDVNKRIAADIQNKYSIKKEKLFTDDDYDIFTPLKLKDPRNLRQLIDLLDSIDFAEIDTDVKGDAFEFFIRKAGTELGEYFTPREVVKAMVHIVRPKLLEKIYDPFCGTGGFLIYALKYLQGLKDDREFTNASAVICSSNGEGNFKHDYIGLYEQSHVIYGGEISSNARIAKMNLLLQGRAHGNIEKLDSLANPRDGLYDVVITNIPFSMKLTEKIIVNGKSKTINDISPLYYNGLAGNSGDATCVLHCLRALKKGGRMALIVPEGFLYRQQLAKVREYLLSVAKLEAVISLPQGTFLPYTGVKTSILYFTDVHMPNTQKNYKYFKAENIGVTLNNRRQKIEGINDLDKICKHFN